jgi:hypothetical protein
MASTVTVTITIDGNGVTRYYVANSEITHAQALAHQNAGARVVKSSQTERPYSGHDNSTSDTI